MFCPFAATPRLSTYSWIESERNPPGIECDTDSAMACAHSISNGMWNRATDLDQVRLSIRGNKPLGYNGRPTATAITTTRAPPVIMQQRRMTLSTQEQWEHMRAFHLKNSLWPSKERQSHSQMDGGSPLIWTVFHPPLAEERCQTYAWNGHLDNYMPWVVGHKGGTQARPPFISQGLWNTRQSLPDAGQSRQPLASNTTPSVLPHTSPSVASIGSNSMQMAIMIYLFLVQQFDDSGPAAPQVTSTAPWRHWSSQRLHPVPVVKSRKSCSRWTTALIQRQWDTAWDLTTHRNVESFRFGLGLPTITDSCSIHFPCMKCVHSYWPMAPTACWQFP